VDPSSPKQLGELETAVLSVLWKSSSPLSVRDVLAQLQRRPLAYTTVLTVLDRLHDKDLVSREMQGKAFLYRARVSREQWLGEQAARVLTSSPEPSNSAVLMAFLDSAERANPDLVERLSALIRQRRKERAT
jgi:predicted transcriptional regulator